jgi:hypothetical protein
MRFERVWGYLSRVNNVVFQNIIVGMLFSHPLRSCFYGVAHNVSESQNISSEKRTSVSDDQSVGGQAVIEGVMMRSPRRITTAVRKPDKKTLYSHIETAQTLEHSGFSRGHFVF